MGGPKDGRSGRCIGYLRPMINPFIFIIVIVPAAYLFPFATVNYYTHTVAQADIYQHALDGTPIPVETKKIPLEVHLYGICGQSSTLKLIRENEELLLEAGNHVDPQKQATDKAYSTRLQTILGTKLLQIDHFLCSQEDSMIKDPQLRTWCAAGLVVIVLLILASSLSLFCIVVHILAITWRVGKRDDESNHRFRESWVVSAMSEAIAWIASFTSFLYLAFTWVERIGSKSSFETGYVIMLVTSVALSFRSMGVFSQVDSLRCTSASSHNDQRGNTLSLPDLV